MAWVVVGASKSFASRECPGSESQEKYKWGPLLSTRSTSIHLSPAVYCAGRLHWMLPRPFQTHGNFERAGRRIGTLLMRFYGHFALVLLALFPAMGGADTRFDADAVKLNNRGVAQMGQQFTERAAQSFADSFKKDPKLSQAAINEGIALVTLQKLDEAKKSLQQAIALDPTSPQAWYNLGLVGSSAMACCSDFFASSSFWRVI